MIYRSFQSNVFYLNVTGRWGEDVGGGSRLVPGSMQDLKIHIIHFSFLHRGLLFLHIHVHIHVYMNECIYVCL